MTHVISLYFGHIPHKLLKKAWYHNAVYDTCYFILLWKIPHK